MISIHGEGDSTKEYENSLMHQSSLNTESANERPHSFTSTKFNFRTNNKAEFRNIVQDISQVKRPTLDHTMVFTEHMNDGYTDSSHMNKVLKSIDSQELLNNPGDLKIEKQKNNDNNTFFYTYHYSPTKAKTVLAQDKSKRRQSEAVRLDTLPQSNLRRFTKFQYELRRDNDIAPVRNTPRHKESLDSIIESVNESQDGQNPAMRHRMENQLYKKELSTFGVHKEKRHTTFGL